MFKVLIMIIYTFFIFTVGMHIGSYAERYDVYKLLLSGNKIFLIDRVYECDEDKVVDQATTAF